MYIVFFSSSIDTIDEWKMRHSVEDSTSCYDLQSLELELENNKECLIIADYDTVSSEFNKLIHSGNIPKNCIVLERAPEIVTGKMLISKGIKAYGNSRMLTHHYLQMLQTILDEKIWTYPELTAALAKGVSTPTISNDAKELIENRLSPKEIDVIYLVLEGLTNDAIAGKLDITPRTVKAHVSSIFSKLHVSDRISLVLLLK